MANAGSLENQRPILNEILPEGFAVVREAGKRVLGMRRFDVRLIGGMVLHEGQIAEMKTGEGKTLVATLPSYLNALTGRGVRGDGERLPRPPRCGVDGASAPLPRPVGLIQQDMRPEERRRNYGCDITYATNSGWDLITCRTTWPQTSAKSFSASSSTVIDEVDSILIDEARTP